MTDLLTIENSLKMASAKVQERFNENQERITELYPFTDHLNGLLGKLHFFRAEMPDLLDAEEYINWIENHEIYVEYNRLLDENKKIAPFLSMLKR